MSSVSVAESGTIVFEQSGNSGTMDERVLLYAEDEDAAVFLLEMALKEANIAITLHRVSDGEEALAFLHHHGAYVRAPKPDMVLLDLNLPRKSGHEVLLAIREDNDLRAIPVVIFTSSSAISDRRKSLALGARMHITKPSSFDGFVDAIKEACGSVGITGKTFENGNGHPLGN